MLSQLPVRTAAHPISYSCRHWAPGKPERIKFTDAIRASMIGSNNVPNEIKKDNLTCTAGDWILFRSESGFLEGETHPA